MQFARKQESISRRKFFGQDLTNASFFTPQTRKLPEQKLRSRNSTITPSRDSKHTVKHASKSSTSKKRVKRGGDQNSEEELRLLIREYVSLKNRSTGDKCVVAEEFQGVCSKIKVGNKIGKFPLCCRLERQTDSIILNKRQRMAQRKKVITEIQDDLQIMISGRKKEEDNIKSKTSAYWTNNDEGDFLYCDKVTEQAISPTEFHTRYNMYLSGIKTLKSESLHNSLSVSPCANVEDKNLLKVVSSSSVGNTLSDLDTKLVAAIKKEYRASLEDAERECWIAIKNAIEHYEIKCAGSKESMNKQLRLIQGQTMTSTTRDDKTVCTPPNSENISLQNIAKNIKISNIPDVKSIVVPMDSLLAKKDACMTEISTETVETVAEKRNEIGTAERNTFQGLAKSTLDIKKNRKRKGHNRRLSIDSQYKSVSTKYNRRKSIASNCQIENSLDNIENFEDPSTSTTLEGFAFDQYSSSDSSDSDW